MKEPALTTSALVLHNLGLAAGFGGALFAQASLNPAVKTLRDPRERSELIDEAWRTQKWIHWAALGATAVTWLTGRSLVSDRLLGKDVRRLVVFKDALLGATVAGSIASAILGNAISQGRPPIQEEHQPSAQTPAPQAGAQKAMKIIGTLNLLAMAGVIGVTAWLSQKAMSSSRWGLLSRALP